MNPPAFDATPSKPRAPRWARLLVYLGLLLLAVAAIWWIDRGVLRTNQPHPVQSQPAEPPPAP